MHVLFMRRIRGIVMSLKPEEFDGLLRGRRFKYALREIFRRARSTYDLKQVEIEVLLYVSAHPEASASDIASALLLQKGHVSLAVDRLRQKGYLECAKDEKDRRYVRFQVLERGENICSAVRTRKAEFDRQAFAGFSEEEIEQFESLSRRLMDNISQIAWEESIEERQDENRS